MTMEPVRPAAVAAEADNEEPDACCVWLCVCGMAATATDALVVLTAPLPSATLLITSTLAAMTRRSMGMIDQRASGE
jgi:hypothetical protein